MPSELASATSEGDDSEIAQRISQAIGKPVRYLPIAPEERRRTLLARGTAREFADALDEQIAERLRRPESRVYLGTLERFGVRPAPFGEFASRNAAAFRGDPPLS